MDRELADLHRGYREERRRMFRDPDPDDEGETACPFDRAWCDPTAALDDDGGFPCFSCHLRQDREDGGPHPAVDPTNDEQNTARTLFGCGGLSKPCRSTLTAAAAAAGDGRPGLEL